ncbi:MAG: hypothetical protein AAGF04_00560 [Chlamydiota bacterium]
MYRIFLLFLLVTLVSTFPKIALAETSTASIAEIEKELASAEERYKRAKESFQPWYSGPLLTGSSSTVPIGMINTQPYLFVTNNYAKYNKKRHTENVQDTLVLNPLAIIQTGIFPRSDLVLNVGGVYQWQGSVSAGGYSDTGAQWGIQLVEEGPYVPAIKLYVNQNFPTGKFEQARSSKKGLDLIGNGSFVTALSLNTSKVIWWFSQHPMNLRLTCAVDVYASDVDVEGIHAYGGGADTKGTIQRGHELKLNLGYQGSITQALGVVCDVVYNYTDSSTFSGFPGTSSSGVPAENGTPSQDNLSLAPGIEYNFDSNSGIVAGMWFSVYGRNDSAFFSGIFTYQITF